MTITNTWKVVQMDAYPEFDGETDVVFTVHWTLTGTDGTYAGSVYGSTPVSLVVSDGFTAFADLTEAQVLVWVKDSLGVAQVLSYENNVAQQIADQISPPVIKPPLPWSN